MSGSSADIVLVIIAGIFCLGYFITSIVFSFKYNKYDFENIINEIENSINGKLIYNLTFRDKCYSNEEKLIFGKYDGLEIEGCNCKGSIKGSGCTKDDLNNGCTKIDPIQSKYYTKINSNYICAIKSTKTYRELLKTNQIRSKNAKCPQNYISCGIIDTLNRKLCVKTGEICPINIEYLENKELYSLNGELYNENNIDFSTNISVNDNKQILSIFKINEYIPCMNPSEKNWTYHTSIEPKNKKCLTTINNFLNDFRYEQWPNINTTKYELYKDNEITIFDKEKAIKEYVYLYGRNFIGFEEETIEEFSYENLISAQTVSNRCGFGMMILSIIFFSILISPIGGLCGATNRNHCNDKSCRIGCYIFMGFIILSAVGTFLIDIIFTIIIFTYFEKIKSVLNKIESDIYTNEAIQIFISQNSINYKFPLAIIILFGLTLIFGIILLITYIIKREKKRKIDFLMINDISFK